MSEPVASSEDRCYRFGVFDFDARALELRKGGRLFRARPQSLKLLTLLLSRARHVLGACVLLLGERRTRADDARVVDGQFVGIHCGAVERRPGGCPGRTRKDRCSERAPRAGARWRVPRPSRRLQRRGGVRSARGGGQSPAMAAHRSRHGVSLRHLVRPRSAARTCPAPPGVPRAAGIRASEAGVFSIEVRRIEH
jgi:hypothetical protein